MNKVWFEDLFSVYGVNDLSDIVGLVVVVFEGGMIVVLVFVDCVIFDQIVGMVFWKIRQMWNLVLLVEFVVEYIVYGFDVCEIVVVEIVCFFFGLELVGGVIQLKIKESCFFLGGFCWCRFCI